ncbi:MAG: alcohol dehydrogenase [Halioglobus sp.]|jgi:alcohol dehydrogenase
MNFFTLIYYKFMAFAVTWAMRLVPRPSSIIFKGSNSALALCEEVSILGFSRVHIVTDEFLSGSGILDGVKEVLTRTGVEFTVFNGIQPDPTFDQVQAGEAALQEYGSEAIVAVGGGSVMDAAKMMALLHTNPGTLKSFDGIQKGKHPSLPLFAIPTTAGTGSEITFAAVITDPISHKKTPVIDSKMIPGHIALDPEIMKGMPQGITAATGMDALTHAVESYLSKASTASTEQQAKAAIRMIFTYLTRAYHNGGDMEAREAMAMASFYAGSAFGRTSVGYVHGIAHQLGRVCNTPHGNANAMVLPEVLTAYGSCIDARMADLARLVQVGETGDSDNVLAGLFIQGIIELRAEMELPLKPKGLTQTDIPDIVKEAQKETGNLYPVPRYMSAEEIRQIVTHLLPA